MAFFWEVEDVGLNTFVMKQVLNKNSLHQATVETLLYCKGYGALEQGAESPPTETDKTHLDIVVLGNPLQELCYSNPQGMDRRSLLSSVILRLKPRSEIWTVNHSPTWHPARIMYRNKRCGKIGKRLEYRIFFFFFKGGEHGLCGFCLLVLN